MSDQEYQEDDSMIDDAIDQAFQLEQMAEKQKAKKAAMPVFLPPEMLIEIASQLTNIKDIVAFGHTNRAYHAAAVTVIQDLYRATGHTDKTGYKNMIDALTAIEMLYKRSYRTRHVSGSLQDVVQKQNALRKPRTASKYSLFVKKISQMEAQTFQQNVTPTLNFPDMQSQSAITFQETNLNNFIGRPYAFGDLFQIVNEITGAGLMKMAGVLWGMLSNEDRNAIIHS
jgi:hypothetical protein